MPTGKQEKEEYHIVGEDSSEVDNFEIPSQITLEFIKDKINSRNRKWVEYIVDHYVSILSLFDKSKIPLVCSSLAATIHASYSPEDSAAYRINQMKDEIKILKIGFNTHLELITKDQVYQNPKTVDDLMHMTQVAMIATDLQFFLGCCMCSDDRPISGMDYLQRAMVEFQRLNQACVTFKRDQKIESMWKVSWNFCRAKQSENWVNILQFLPEEDKPVFAQLVYDQIVKTMDDYWAEGREDLIRDHGMFYQYAKEYTEKYPLSKKERDELYRDSITDDYVRWCNDHCLFLNLLTEPTHNCKHYAKDNLKFSLDERYQWLLDDIVATFDHCRRTLYKFDKIDEKKVAEKKRDEDIESLLDCYVRLYTLLDKTAKLIAALFPGDGSLKDKNFYKVAEAVADSRNKFLASIYLIKNDIFPEEYDISDNVSDPHRNYLGVIQKTANIRNEIVHGTVRMFSENESKGWYYDSVALTPLELKHHTITLAYDIREILLTLQLAVGWHRRYA